jgi:aminoglycoside/choline kinase family phosphotransferase
MTPSDSSPSRAAAASPPIVWNDPARGAAFAQWLAATSASFQLDPATLRLASADASFRRYLRIDQGAGSCIIMDAPPALEDCAPFVKVAELMAQAGLNAPRVLAWDAAQGFMLLTDLGAHTMMQVIQQQGQGALELTPQAGQTVHQLYMDAVDVLIRWQLSSRPDVLPAYDDGLLSRELALFPDWYIARHRGIAVDAGLQQKLDGFFAQIKDSNLHSLGGARVFVHRDFMPRNLMACATSDPANSKGANNPAAGPPQGGATPSGGSAVSVATSVRANSPVAGPPQGGAAPPGGSAVREATSVGANSLGVLDFQDAVYGPITYDIASLMRDAFLSWDEEFVLDITIRYWQKARKAGLPVGDDFGEFYRAVEWMGLQRHLKILGIFARLTLRDGKPQYLADTPRFIKYARSTASRYRQLGPLMVLLDEIEGNETRVGYTF